MSRKVNIGGDRLGSGNKMETTLHGFNRSNHDLSTVKRTTMAAGVLTPLYCEPLLPGDEFNINVYADVKTVPTVGPLFGSFKFQVDLFQVPMRLYQGRMHMNLLQEGLEMTNVKFPQILLESNFINQSLTTPIELQQINQSSLLAYIGIRGLGNAAEGVSSPITAKRTFNAVPLCAYYDIVKNYYINKQESTAWFINYATPTPAVYYWKIKSISGATDAEATYPTGNSGTITVFQQQVTSIDHILITISGSDIADFKIGLSDTVGGTVTQSTLTTLSIDGWSYEEFGQTEVGVTYKIRPAGSKYIRNLQVSPVSSVIANVQVSLDSYNTKTIDDFRLWVLQQTMGTTQVNINSFGNTNAQKPYSDLFSYVNATTKQLKASLPMQGLALKTYQSDIFNNWLNTEWIDGVNGINQRTKISTASDSFTLDTLNLAKKVYDMLNRIAVSGGSYKDWLEAVYDVNAYNWPESPVYEGSLIKEIVFQEVVSNAASFDDNGRFNPLGSLAGRGRFNDKNKGGKMNVKAYEPAFLIAIASITPRIDYYQGNKWWLNLKTMDDLHKPSLDGIGFQDLVTENMAFWDVKNTGTSVTKYSAGKQPAWINYMTAVNELYGDYADERSQMFMTLARRYSRDSSTGRIKDLTTYIDPTKFNYAFSDVSLSAQNFWVQVGFDIEARRIMSQKVIPNL